MELIYSAAIQLVCFEAHLECRRGMRCIARRGVQAFHPPGWSLICPHYQPPPAYTRGVPCHDHDEGVEDDDGDVGDDDDLDDVVDVGDDGDDGCSRS